MPNTDFFFKSCLKRNFSLLAYLPDRLEVRRCNKWPLKFATITNSPVGCAFSGSDECLPSAPCYSLAIAVFFFM